MNMLKISETREFYALKELTLLNARMVASCTKALKQAGAFDNPKDVDVVLGIASSMMISRTV